jgi:Cys-tRNA(Pro) deacylase
MKNELSPSAKRIQDYLVSRGYDFKVIEFLESTRTSAEAAERVGCEVGQIVKSLVFCGHNSGKAVLVLACGANRVDVRKLANLIGEPVDRAKPEFVRTVTGFAIGGIPPIGHISKLETFVDEDLRQYQKLWAAAGTPNAIFELTFEDLVKMSSARIVEIKEI